MHVVASEVRPARIPASSHLTFVRQQPIATVSLLVILVVLLAGILAPQIAPYDPLAADYGASLSPPSLAHLAGTDAFGRDVLSRLIHGSRSAIVIGVTSAFIGCTLGAIIGTASAYFGGRTDAFVQRVVDMVLSFPLIVLALVVGAILGRNLVFGVDLSLIVAIAVPIVAPVSRVLRAAALSVRAQPYIDAAITAGYSHVRIVMKHMAPNLSAPYLIMLSAYVAQAILLEAALSFLGVGVSEPTPSWGLMLSGNATDFFTTAPWLIIFPGLAISVVVIAFNLFGDGLRDWLDPRFKA
jgi:peptide/nickel transport system permease protein